MTNVKLITSAMIDLNVLESEMRAYVDLSKFWRKNQSVNAAYEELLMSGVKIDRRTLAGARDGTLARSEYITLVRLRDWARKLSGNEVLTIDDILVIKDEEEQM